MHIVIYKSTLQFLHQIAGLRISGSKYSRMDQVKLVKTAFKKFEVIWILFKAVFHKSYLVHSWITWPKCVLVITILFLLVLSFVSFLRICFIFCFGNKSPCIYQIKVCWALWLFVCIIFKFSVILLCLSTNEFCEERLVLFVPVSYCLNTFDSWHRDKLSMSISFCSGVYTKYT